MLNWRNATSSLVKGTVLATALYGKQSRFQICEVRTYDADRNSDVCYHVRDAHGVTDKQIAEGQRSPVVGRFETIEEALRFCDTC